MIDPHALERIRTSEITGPELAELFEQLVQGVSQMGLASGGVTLDFCDEPRPGDWVPQIHLTLKQVGPPAPETVIGGGE